MGGGTIANPVVKIGKLHGKKADETFTITGSIVLPGVTLEPAEQGLQILLEDLGRSETLIDLTADGTPVPPGGRGTGCERLDGWRNLFYRNLSGALPPLCSPDSAQGLRRIRFDDARDRGGDIAFIISGRGADIETKPIGPLRLTIVLGADRAAGLAGACAVDIVGETSCRAKRSVFRCK